MQVVTRLIVFRDIYRNIPQLPPHQVQQTTMLPLPHLVPLLDASLTRCTVGPRIRHRWSMEVGHMFTYSASSVIRTLIIRHLDYPNAKFHKLHPHYESHVGLGNCEILQNGVFQSSKATRSAKSVSTSVVLCIGSICSQELANTQLLFDNQRSTTVTKS